MTTSYYAPKGGHPGQDQLLTDRAMFTEAYAVIPKGTMRDITTSFLPFWENTRLWVIARPLTGFAETFSHYIMEVGPGGGSDRAETDPEAEGVLFVVEGSMSLTVGGKTHEMMPGGYAFLPPQSGWTLRNTGTEPLRFHWLRKAYQAVEGLDHPEVIVKNEADVAPSPMPGTDGKWATTRFVDPNDLRHDMHVTIVTLERGLRVLSLACHEIPRYELIQNCAILPARILNNSTRKQFGDLRLSLHKLPNCLQFRLNQVLQCKG